MKVNVVVPRLGANMFEATLVIWLKTVGDSVAKGEAIAEIMTDKVNIDVEAPADGVLAEVRADAGGEVKVDGVIAVIEAADGA